MSTLAEERAQFILNLDPNDKSAVQELLSVVRESKEQDSAARFTATVSNPPYSTGRSFQVYPYFWLIGSELSERVSMVFPNGWQKSNGVGKGSGMFLLKGDTRIVSVDNYYETNESPIRLFPDVGTAGVNIMFGDSTKTDAEFEFYEHGKFVEDRTDWDVVSEFDTISESLMLWMEQNSTESLKQRLTQTAHIKLSQFLKDRTDKQISLTPVDGWVEAYGSLDDTNYGWAWVDPNHSGLRLDKPGYEASKYKVIFGVASGAYSIHRKAMVLGPNQVGTQSYVSFYFETQQQADNFRTFQKTLFYRGCVTSTATTITTGGLVHRFVPDLSNTVNPRTNLVGWESDWNDSDLKTLFSDLLSVDDWEYLEEVALVSDPVGQKSQQ